MMLLNPRNHYGKEDVIYWENFLSDEDIHFLRHHPSWMNYHTAEVGDAVEDYGIRRTNVAWVDFSEQNQHIWQKIAKVVSDINSQFFHINLTGFYEDMQLSEYSAAYQGHYNWHTDACSSDKQVPRKLSMVLMLSDANEYEGGELQIKTSDHDETLEMQMGRAWFFPSYMLHRVTPVTKGLRKTAVLWVGGEPWR